MTGEIGSGRTAPFGITATGIAENQTTIIRAIAIRVGGAMRTVPLYPAEDGMYEFAFNFMWNETNDQWELSV